MAVVSHKGHCQTPGGGGDYAKYPRMSILHAVKRGLFSAHAATIMITLHT